MKYIKHIAFSLLLFFFVMAMLTGNNFNPDGNDVLGLENSSNVTSSEIENEVLKLTAPLLDCLKKSQSTSNEDTCEQKIDLVFGEESHNHSEAEININSHIYGELVFIQCDEESHLADVHILYAENIVEMRTFFGDPWTKADKFVENSCARL